MTNDNMKSNQNTGTGKIGQNGFVPSKTEKKVSTIQLYCMKCGKLKSTHGFFGQCPK